jgi:hypothetical protein
MLFALDVEAFNVTVFFDNRFAAEDYFWTNQMFK